MWKILIIGADNERSHDVYDQKEVRAKNGKICLIFSNRIPSIQYAEFDAEPHDV